MGDLAKKYAVRAAAVDARRRTTIALKKARVGLYRPWNAVDR